MWRLKKMTEQQEDLYTLPESTLNALLQYLVTKPSQEVSQLIQAAQAAKKVEVE
jgi:hypothetical protein